MWKIQAREQKEKASDMRRRNEALVYNVLPGHVAEHFMSKKKRSYDELYSQSYAEVGVLFASMPNFSGMDGWMDSTKRVELILIKELTARRRLLL